MARKTALKDFMLLFRGGADPRFLSKAEMQAIMDKWHAWIGQLRKEGRFERGEPLADGGKVLSGKRGQHVAAFMETDEAVGGYCLIKARSLAEATRIARGCPILDNNGTVEVRPIRVIPGT
jgi:hypothetical protein